MDFSKPTPLNLEYSRFFLIKPFPNANVITSIPVIDSNSSVNDNYDNNVKSCSSSDFLGSLISVVTCNCIVPSLIS